MPEIITHLIFRDTLFSSQLSNSITHELCVHMIFTTYLVIILGDDRRKITHDFTPFALKTYRGLCYNTENYVFCSAVQVIYQIVFVYSVSKMF